MMARVSDERPKQNLKTDVLIVGGGAAGVAAAFTAAKAGAGVLLLEKYGFCGGAAVAGLSGTVCGLYAATDNRAAPPERVVFGFADRFLDVMKMKGGVTDPVRYGKTFTLIHDPLVWRETGDDLLAEAGVKVLFHTTVVDVLNDGDQVEGVVAWTKQGRVDIQAGLTIDASGDADVAALAGFETFIGRDGNVQNPTMLFRLMGVDVARFLAHYGEDSILGDEVSQMIRNLHNSQRIRSAARQDLHVSDAAAERTALQLHAHHRPGRSRAQSAAGRRHYRSGNPGSQAGARICPLLQGSPRRLRKLLRQ